MGASLVRGVLAGGLLGMWAAPAQGAIPKLQLELVNSAELFAPVGIVPAGDGSGRLFIVEQRGQIRIMANDALLETPFLDLGGKLVPERPGFDERGLLGLAFHPDYGMAGADGGGRFYVYYSAPSPDAPGTAEDPVEHRSVVAEYRVSAGDANLAEAGSERVLLTFNQPQFNHNGGHLAFGPDGMLYIASGDGGSSNDNNAGHTGGDATRPSNALGNAQDRTKLLGKILRIDPLGSDGPGGQYGIPADNPFVGEGDGVREEIYAYGLRNPWRFSFDDGPGGTNRLFCADVGQGAVEEVNLIVSGGNYGWRNKEGTFTFDAGAPAPGPFIDPVAQYGHPGATNGLPAIGLSVTGGYVYRGSAIPGLVGTYVFADWSSSFGAPSGTLLGLEEPAPGQFSLSVLELVGTNPIPFYLAAFGVDESGELYLAAKTTRAPSAPAPGSGLPSGTIFRLVAAETGGTASAELSPSKDNSIFSEGPLSNGSGAGLFAGRTNNGNLRRALLAFDVAGALPAGTTVQSAALTLQVDNTIAFAGTTMGLHRLLADWGEAGSNAGLSGGMGAAAQPNDATWESNFFGSSAWSTPGGDFNASASATTSVAGLGSYEWSGSVLAADVQSFLDAPGQNFGWILVSGNEATTSAKRFVSREGFGNGPRLAIEYSTPPPSNFEAWRMAFFDDGEVVDLDEDLDGDLLNGLFEYGAGLDPKAANPVSDAYASEIDPTAPEGSLVVTFRRDPRATDLTYRVEGSFDLVGWTMLAESRGGMIPTGDGLVSDHPLPSAPPFREVTVRDVVSFPDEGERFIRFVVILTGS